MEKKCKGTGKANGYGCGKLSEQRKYGLGFECKCYQKWLFETKQGQEIINKRRLSAKKQVSKIEQRKDKVSKINYADKLQSKVQEIARLIDLGHPCLARGKMSLSYDGGHVWSKGGHSECRYNLHNIFAQDSKSNQSGREDSLMIIGVERVFGGFYREFVENLKNKEVPKYTKVELERFYRIACKQANILKKEGKIFSTKERVSKRNEINTLIGYYPQKLSVF